MKTQQNNIDIFLCPAVFCLSLHELCRIKKSNNFQIIYRSYKEMTSLQGSHLVSVLIIILIIRCEGKTEIGDYIVDCSVCNSVPVQGISSYSCKVRCDLQGEY